MTLTTQERADILLALINRKNQLLATYNDTDLATDTRETARQEYLRVLRLCTKYSRHPSFPS